MRSFLVLLWLVHWLPLSWLGRLGEGLGYMLFWLARERRHVVLTNLRCCFPLYSVQQQRILALKHFQALGRSVLEHGLLWWSSEKRLRRLIVFKNPPSQLNNHTKPTIFLCPHFVSLDVAGVALSMNTPGCAIYSQQSHPVLDRIIRRGRSRFQPVALYNRSKGIKPILRHMQQGLPFFMCPDMDFGSKDAVFVPFFGVPAATLTAPARLATLTGAVTIPITATMLPHYRGWQVEFHAPWQPIEWQHPAQGALRMNQFVEQQIARAPAEYLWSHRRFKTRPAGQPDIYIYPSLPVVQNTGSLGQTEPT